MYEYIISLVIIYISYKIFIKYYYMNLISYYNSDLRKAYNKNIFYTDLYTDEEKKIIFDSLIRPKKRLIDYFFGYDITNSIIYTLMCHKNTFRNDSCIDILNECKNYEEAKDKLSEEYGFDPDLLDKIRNLKSVADENYSDDEYNDNETESILTQSYPNLQQQNFNKIISGVMENFKNMFGADFNIQELTNALENSN